MDLYLHDRPPFTRWVLDEGLLHEPIVVLDVGVQGGEHPRWNVLGDHVRVFGFDPIQEAIDRLSSAGPRPNRVYRALALGNEDGQRTLYVPANTFGASFFESPDLEIGERVGDGQPGPRTVPIARLDTLFDAGEIPPADYIQICTEGFDHEVLRGGQRYLARSNILCVSTVTAFTVTRHFHRPQYPLLHDLALDHRLQLFDIGYWRYARSSYLDAKARHPWPTVDPMDNWPDMDVGQPIVVKALFGRDLVMEDASPERFGRDSDAVVEPTIDKLIKLQVLFELHGLMDCAVDIAQRFRARLAERLDVDRAIGLLAERPPHARYTRDIVNYQEALLALRRRVEEGSQARAAVEASLSAERTAREAEIAALRERLAEAQREIEETAAKLASPRFLLGALGQRLGRGLRRP